MSNAVGMSPGLQALMSAMDSATAAGVGGTGEMATMALSTLPPTPHRPHPTNRPVTGMSLLQSPSGFNGSSGNAGSMLPPPSPLVGGNTAPPPSPAIFATATPQSQTTHSLRVRQSHQLPGGTRLREAEEDDADEEEDEADMEDVEDNEDQDETFVDGAGDGHDDASSQSCPPSPLANLARLSGAATSNGRRASVSAASARRRSVGSHHQATDRAHSSERHHPTFKRPKVSTTAGAREFKKSNGKATPSAVTGGAAGEAVGSVGGSSCHQCKSRRLVKFYRESPHPTSGPSADLNWSCPSCRGICCCAACRRREQRLEEAGMKRRASVADTAVDADDRDEVLSPSETPMPTPLYRGEHEPPVAHSLQSNAAHLSSPSAISMQRLLLSPTNSHAMAPLPPAGHSMRGTPSKHHYPPRSYSGTPNDSASTSSHSPSPEDNGVPANHMASLAALSQAAMQSPIETLHPSHAHLHHHPITISLQSNGPTTLPAASPGASPNDALRTPSSMLQQHSSVTSTPKYTSLLSSANGSTPRLMPVVPRTTLLSTPLLNGASASLKSPYSSIQQLQLSALPSAALVSGSGASHPTATASGGDSVTEIEDVGTREADERSNSSNGSGRDAVVHPHPHHGATTHDDSTSLSSFAMFYALGQLPSVQAEVHAVLSSQDGTKNRDRLKRIEGIFARATERALADLLPLQL